MPHIKEGFNNQISFILPENIQGELQTGPLTNLLFATDIGYYPSAKYHFRERKDGCDQHILIFCTDGCGWIRWGGGTKSVRKGMFAMIPARVAHSYGSDNDNPWSIYWLHFKGGQSNLLAGNSVRLGDTGAGDTSRNDRRIRLFEEMFQNLTMGYSRENLEFLSVSLWYLLGSFAYASQFERIRTPEPTDVVERSIVFMKGHLAADLSLDQIAAHCKLSVSHFSKIFKAKTRRSPIDYYNELKIQRACQLLDHSNLKMIDIARQVGIGDPFYFSRLFSKIMGVSPSQYKHQKKG